MLCGNTNLRETKNTHQALWICNSNDSSPLTPLYAFPFIRLPFYFADLSSHISFRRGDLLFNISPFAAAALFSSSYGARDYRRILNIAASKSWISISYIISAAQCCSNMTKRVAQGPRYRVKSYAILDPCKIYAFDHSHSK